MSGSITQILLHRAALWNGMATGMCSQMHFHLHNTNRRVRTQDGPESTYFEEVRKALITVQSMTQAFNVLVMSAAQFCPIIARLAIKTISASLDIYEGTAIFLSGNKQ